MTGQVKEEVLSRFAELGIRVNDGAVRFQPQLLRAREFFGEPREFRFLDIDGNWQTQPVPGSGLAFTWCQVPVIYVLDNDAEPSLTITRDDGSHQVFAELALPSQDSAEIFQRSGRIRRIDVTFGSDVLFNE